MKRKFYLLSFLLICLVSLSIAQNVPNGGFEEWEFNASNILEPVTWQTNNLDDLTFVYQEYGHSGQFSAKISVEWSETLAMNVPPILYKHGNFPVSERFTSLEFYLMGETLDEDYLNVSVGMFNNGINIGLSLYPIYNDYFAWTKVTVPINYSTGDVPDECFISLTIWPGDAVHLGSYCFIDDLELSMGSAPVPPLLLAAVTNVTGTAFELNFNTLMSDPSGLHDQFSGTHNGSPVTFTSASLKPGNNGTIVLGLASPVASNEVLKVSYVAGTVTSAEGMALESFTNEEVTNLVGVLEGFWQVVPSGVTENLHSVHLANTSVGYIGGEWGKCLKTTNGGFNWSTIGFPSPNWLLAVWATSPDVVHIGAWDTVFNTNNGGQSWTPAYLNTVNYYVTDMQFHTANLGYIFLQASAFKKTTDGGNTWSEIVGAGVIDDFLAGYMIDQNNGWAVGGAGLIAYTTDGGQTWPQYQWNEWTEWSPITIQGVHFTSAMNGFAVADSGVLFRTTNGGEHWTKSYIAGPEDNLMDIYFLNANLGWIVGYHGIIFSTTDGGNNWNLEPAITTEDLNSVFFISNNLGCAVGNNGTILRFGTSNSSVQDHSLLTTENIRIFPNPCSSKASLMVSLPEKLELSIDIYDLTGRKLEPVFMGTLSKGNHVLGMDFPEFRNGVYFCRISYSGGHVCKSFLINK